MAEIGKITPKGQTTIPVAVRAALSIGPGDLLEWTVTGEGYAVVRRVPGLDVSYFRASEYTLGEWLSKEDDEAYRDL